MISLTRHHAATLAILVALAACRPPSTPVVIATAGPWAQMYGAMHRRGVQLAVEELNREGGVAGRPIRLVERDDAGDGSRAAAIAQELVEDPRVLAVVGHVNSSAMLASARIYDRQLAAVATTVTSPDLSGISPWVFRVISSDSVNGVDLARFAASLGRRRAALLYENDNYGRGLMESFRRGFPGTIVSVDPIAAEATDVEPYIAYLKRRAPDVVFVASTNVSALALLREARRQQLTADFLGGDGWTGVVADTAAAEGVYIGAPFSPDDSREAVRRFVAAFRARFGTTPDGNAALAYDATRLVARAIEQGGDSRRAVRDWLASLDPATAFPGVTGAIRFRDTGDVVGKGFVMTRVERGALHVLARAAR